MIPASIAPKNGDASTAAEIAIARIPTPMRKNRDTPDDAATLLTEQPFLL